MRHTRFNSNEPPNANFPFWSIFSDFALVITWTNRTMLQIEYRCSNKGNILTEDLVNCSESGYKIPRNNLPRRSTKWHTAHFGSNTRNSWKCSSEQIQNDHRKATACFTQCRKAVHDVHLHGWRHVKSYSQKFVNLSVLRTSVHVSDEWCIHKQGRY